MINNNAIIQRYQYGIQLTNKPLLTDFCVENVLALPLNFYFMDRDSYMIKINETAVQTNGYVSVKDAIGKSIRHISKSDTANQILENDKKAIESKTLQIAIENFTRFDETELTALSIKFPWFHQGEVAGIFGCSILFEKNNSISFAYELSLLMQTGLLTPQTFNKKLQGAKFSDVYFDQRDTEILYFLVRGNTAKNIAKKMNLSYRTIEHRLEMIKHKLNVTSKSELIDKIIDNFINQPFIM